MFRPSVPRSPNKGWTYVLVPRDFLQRLFGVFGMDLPTEFMKPDFSKIIFNDTIPTNIDLSTISIGQLLPAPSRFSYLTRILQRHRQ